MEDQGFRGCRDSDLLRVALSESIVFRVEVYGNCLKRSFYGIVADSSEIVIIIRMIPLYFLRQFLLRLSRYFTSHKLQ